MVTTINDWSDFDWFVNTYLPYQTIPILKEFATTYENITGGYAGVRSQEKKDNLVEKVKAVFIRLKVKNELEQYKQVRQMCEHIGKPKPMYNYPHPHPPPTFGGVPAGGSSSSFHSPSAAPLPNPTSSARYLTEPEAYRAPSYAANSSRQAGSGWGSVPASSSNVYAQRGTGPNHTLQDWRPNPMFKAVKALTAMEMLPDILHTENTHVRREKRSTFLIPQDVVDKLQQSRTNPNSSPRYSLRLFCASSDYYRPPHGPYNPSTAHVTNQSIPIEYPNNPDVYLNHMAIKFEARGLRGKPGSAPPFDLNKDNINKIVLDSGRPNTMTMGHTGPTTGKRKDQTKRFWFQVVLAEVTTKEDLLSRLNGLKPMAAEDVIDTALRKSEDDEIVIGASKMTLKDPLSFVRIKRPVRSLECGHGQCFEPQWWLDANSVHPQFLCPLCNKPLKFNTLILDGFFLDILNTVPDSVEEVVLESDYQWHTEDNKYGSAEWLRNHAPPMPITNGDVKPDRKQEPMSPSDTQSPADSSKTDSPNVRGKRKAIEILSDSEDEDEIPLRPGSHAANGSRPPYKNGPVASYRPPSRPPPPLRTPSTTASVPPPSNGGVIDLTLDSSDEEDEGEGSNQPSYFRPPGAGSTERDAAGSIPHLTLRPPLHRLPSSETGARPYNPTAAFLSATASGSRTNGDVRAHGSAVSGGGHWSPNPLELNGASAYTAGQMDGERSAFATSVYRPPPKRPRPNASDYMDQDLYDQF